MFKVVYFSMGGKTKKVAEVIASELGVTAENIRSAGAIQKDDLVFLGSGCYGAVLVKDITSFIERNKLEGRKIALFTTSAFGLGKEIALMKKQLSDRGVIVVDHFNCFGQFLALQIGHPNTADLRKAREFARLLSSSKFENQQISEDAPFTATAGKAN
jgi:flavodoxin